jgi:hypothetical protein
MAVDRKKYAQELDKMQGAKTVAVELSPLHAVAIVNHVQLAVQQQCSASHKVSEIAVAGARQIQETVLDPESTAYQILEEGWGVIEQYSSSQGA